MATELKNYIESGKSVFLISEEKEFSNLFTTYMNLWYDYVNACNSMYTEYTRNLTKMTESWLDSISFWSVQYRDKAKIE
jgi:hypothetical protein